MSAQPLFRAAFFTMADGWKQGWCPLRDGRAEKRSVHAGSGAQDTAADNEALPAPASRDSEDAASSQTSHTQKDEQRFHPHEARDSPVHRGGRQTRQYRLEQGVSCQNASAECDEESLHVDNDH